MALAKKRSEIFQQVTVKNAAELAGVSAMFVVVRAKSNVCRHIQNSLLPNIAPNTNRTRRRAAIEQ
jgi:hypothetical protein